MKHFFACIALFFIPLLAFAEEVTSFVSDIYLNENGTFVVMETVEYDFGSADRHGIYRDILKQHPQGPTSSLKERYLDIDIQGVSLNGASVPYSVDEGSEKVSVKIGDPKRTVTGAQTYVISYLVTGGYSYFKDGTAELYWNATGNEWIVPITYAQVNLRAVSSLFGTDSACYKGGYGSTLECDSVTKSDDSVVTFIATNLGVGENLTIGQQLNGAQLRVLILEQQNILVVLLCAVVLFFLSLLAFAYFYRTYHKTNRTIVPQYEPYQKFKPMFTGMLFDGRLDPHDITAGIVHLAQLGIITIEKIDKKVLFVFDVDDYKVTLKKTLIEVPSSYLRDVLYLFFSGGAQVGQTVTLGDIKTDMQKQRDNYTRLHLLRGDLKRDMRLHGFFEVQRFAASTLKLLIGLVIGQFTIVLVAVLFFFNSVQGSFSWVIPSTFLIAVTFLSVIAERRTRKGYEALDHLKGFKLFLSVTDEERFKFHNAPQKSPEQFMEYLPYAIAFGVEKEWAEAFKDITIPNPDWYQGGSVGSFSAMNVTSSLGAFSSAVAMASSSVSSSSSSFGGSGGGGFSGGGGGGGGGGSW